MKKILALVLAMALAASTFVACGGGDAAVNYPGTAGTDSITVDLGTEPPDMCTITTTDNTSMNVIRQCIENLVTLDNNDEVAPGVAESWEYDEETLTYTFHLREMNWSNGEALTAKDFEFAWKALLDPSFASDYAYFGFIIKNGEAVYNGEMDASELGIEVVDDHTLKLTLEQPTAYALSMLAFPSFAPVHQATYEQFGDTYGTDADKIITNGPYKITSWVHESELVIEKNEEYYDAANIAIPKVIFKMITDRNTAMNEFKAGNLDMMLVNGEQAAMIKEEGWPVTSYDTGAVWYFEFNTKEPGMNNAKVRQALTMGVDVQSFITNVVKNNSTVATSFTPGAVGIAGVEGTKFKDMVGEVVSRDMEAAKKLLEEGLAEEGLTLETFKPVMICDDTDTAQRNCAYYQEQWKQNLGVTVQITPMPFKSRLEAMSNHQFSVVLAGWSPDYNDPNTYLDMFLTGGGNNHGEYSSEVFDKAIKDAAAETDYEARAELLKTAEIQLMTDMPIGPLYWDVRDYICSAKLQGVHRSTFQDTNLKWASIKAE